MSEFQLVFKSDIRYAQKLLKEAGQLEEQQELVTALRQGAELVENDTKRRIPVRTGRARNSIRSRASKTRAVVVGGKKAVKYYGWLDFGSRTPRKGNPRSVGPWSGSGIGPFRGRFIYQALDANRAQVNALIANAISRALNRIDK